MSTMFESRAGELHNISIKIRQNFFLITNYILKEEYKNDETSDFLNIDDRI